MSNISSLFINAVLADAAYATNLRNSLDDEDLFGFLHPSLT